MPSGPHSKTVSCFILPALYRQTKNVWRRESLRKYCFILCACIAVEIQTVCFLLVKNSDLGQNETYWVTHQPIRESLFCTKKQILYIMIEGRWKTRGRKRDCIFCCMRKNWRQKTISALWTVCLSKDKNRWGR